MKARKTVVTGVEMFRKLLDRAEACDNIGTLLRVEPERDRGEVLAKRDPSNPIPNLMRKYTF